MIQRGLAAAAIACAAVITCPAHSSEMIEIRTTADGFIETPFIDAVTGESLVAVPVSTSPESDEADTGSVKLRRLFLDEGFGPSAVLVGSLRLSTPQIVSASIGVIIGTRDGTHCHEMCVASGILIQAEPGLGGGKLSVGYAWGLGQGVGGLFLLPGAAFDIKASVLRTWGETWSVAPDQTFVGGEVDISLMLLKFSIGVMRRITGDAPGDDWLFTIGGGVGF